MFLVTTAANILFLYEKFKRNYAVAEFGEFNEPSPAPPDSRLRFHGAGWSVMKPPYQRAKLPETDFKTWDGWHHGGHAPACALPAARPSFADLAVGRLCG